MQQAETITLKGTHDKIKRWGDAERNMVIVSMVSQHFDNTKKYLWLVVTWVYAIEMTWESQNSHLLGSTLSSTFFHLILFKWEICSWFCFWKDVLLWTFFRDPFFSYMNRVPSSQFITGIIHDLGLKSIWNLARALLIAH